MKIDVNKDDWEHSIYVSGGLRPWEVKTGHARAKFDVVERESEGRHLGYIAVGVVTDMPVMKLDEKGMPYYVGQKQTRQKFEVPVSKLGKGKVERKVGKYIRSRFVF